MARLITPLFALLLLLAACGGGDETDAGSDGSTETTAAADADAGSEPDTDGGGDTDTATSDGDTTDGDTNMVSSFDDIPDKCLDLFAAFLGEIEPVVEGIDWANATADDLTPIQGQFDTLSTDFEAEIEADPDCAAIDLSEDDSFEQTIAFARDVAPGTVGFWEFLQQFSLGAGSIGGTGGADDGGTDLPGLEAEEFADCAEAVAFMENLTTQYDSMGEIPLSELARIQSLGAIMMTCSPEETAALSAAVESFTP